jgi:hypothetical protein
MPQPSPSPLAGTSRYFIAGTRVYYWVPSIANKNAPTLAEFNAGTDVTAQVAAVAGFDLTTNMLDVPDAGSTYVSTIPGRQTTSASSINFYQSSTSSDIRSLLTQNLTGFLAFLTEGNIVGGKCNVFPVTVASVSPDQNIEGSAQVMIQFGVTSKPAMYINIPTA